MIDGNGNRISLRKRDTSALSYTYDNLNRLTLKTVPERPSGSQALTPAQTRDVHYGYDLRNLQLFARFDSAAGDGVTNSYDPFGRMLSQRIRMGVTDRTLNYGLREDGGRISITHPDGTLFNSDLDVAGRLGAIRENGGATAQIVVGYAPDGVPGAVVRSNNTITAFGYDGVLRPNLLFHDLTGPGRDVGWTFTRNPASGIASQTRDNDHYAYGGHYGVNRPYETNGLNQYTSVSGGTIGYDLNGNLTSSPGPNPNEVLSFVYDIENRLVGAASSTGQSPIVTIFYDPLGRLFSLTASGVTTEYLYDGDALVGEYVWGAQTERYVHGATAADDPLLWYHGNALGDRRSLHADQQGSIIAISDGAGASLATNRYDEYGVPAGTNSGRFQYTGQIWLGPLGMYYYKARIYSPYLGRFLQTDPVEYEDQFNLYAYARNDPVNRVDPNGDESYVVARPVDHWAARAFNVGHGFLVTGARYVGDPRATVTSFGHTRAGTVGNISDRRNAAAPQRDTNRVDRETWLAAGRTRNPENVVRINAPDALVQAVANKVDGSAVDYDVLGPNSTSAAFAVADRAQQQATGNPNSTIDREQFDLNLPGSEAPTVGQIKFTDGIEPRECSFVAAPRSGVSGERCF